MQVTVKFGTEVFLLKGLTASTTMRELREQLARLTQVPLDRQRLVGRKLKGRLPDGDEAIGDVGITDGAVLMLVGSTDAQIQTVHNAAKGAEMRERYKVSVDVRALPAPSPARDGFGFAALQVLEQFSETSQAKAHDLLRKLAVDPGIMAVMKKRSWCVGILSEMYPEGRVGVSDVCVLGLNVNKGQEIKLRLRTDDLAGFRPFQIIRKTLIHELVHIVHSEHNTDFWEMNSALTREADAIVHSGRSTGGGTAGTALPERADTAGGGSSSTHRLGGSNVAGSAREAAAQAALRRQQQQQQQPQP